MPIAVENGSRTTEVIRAISVVVIWYANIYNVCPQLYKSVPPINFKQEDGMGSSTMMMRGMPYYDHNIMGPYMDYFNYPGMMGYAASPYNRGGGTYFNTPDTVGSQQENVPPSAQGIYPTEPVGGLAAQDNPLLFYDQSNNPLTPWMRPQEPLYGGYNVPHETVFFQNRGTGRGGRVMGYPFPGRGGLYQHWRGGANKQSTLGQHR